MDVIRRAMQTLPWQCSCAGRGASITSLFVQCDGCDQWFHTKCHGISPQQADEMEEYFCQDCALRSLGEGVGGVFSSPEVFDETARPLGGGGEEDTGRRGREGARIHDRA